MITLRRVFLIVGLVFLLDLAISVAGVALSLNRIQGRFASVDLTVDRGSALDGVRALAGDARRARWFASHPAYAAAAAAIPDLRVGSELSRAAADIGGRAEDLLELLSGDAAGSLYEEGAVDLKRVRAAAALSAQLHEVLVAWADEIDSGSRPLIERVGRASERAERRLRKTAADAEGASLLLGQLPSILGEDEERSYLLAFQSPSEARGGGGLIGVVAELSARDGQLDLGAIRTVRDLVSRMRGSVAAPEWFKDTYGPLLATREWRAANVSPNFPVTSQVLLRMYERSIGKTLDGVVAADPLAIGALTKATGPLRAEGWNVLINENNARRVLLHDVYRHFHFREHRQNRYFANLIDTIWTALSSGEVDVADLAGALSESTRKQHLKVFLANTNEQVAVEAVGAAGSFDDEAGVQLVFHNNWSANKIDFFLHRRINTRVQVAGDGDARVITEIRLSNENEDPERNVISRPGVQGRNRLGLNRTLVSVLMPVDATRPQAFLEGRLIDAQPGRDGDHPVVSLFVDIPPRQSKVVTVTYRWLRAAEDGRFVMTLFPQATVRPDVVSLAVESGSKKLLQRNLQLKEPLRIFLPVENAAD